MVPKAAPDAEAPLANCRGAVGELVLPFTLAGADSPAARDDDDGTGTGTMGDALEPAAADTGQTVVYRAMVDVKTCVDLAGQFVTVAAHEVIVISFVV